MSPDHAQELVDEPLQAEIDLLGELMAAAAETTGPLPEGQVDGILRSQPAHPPQGNQLD
jgi:hypothetical protein